MCTKTGRRVCCCVTTVSLSWTLELIHMPYISSACFISDMCRLWNSVSFSLICVFGFLLQTFVTIRKFVRLTAPHRWSSPTPPTSTSAGTRCPTPLVGYGPTQPKLLAWPELAVTMETPCVTTSIWIALFIGWFVCVFINAEGHGKSARLSQKAQP